MTHDAASGGVEIPLGRRGEHRPAAGQRHFMVCSTWIGALLDGKRYPRSNASAPELNA
jgi:hypothetical protein